jgi:hypothetical protein
MIWIESLFYACLYAYVSFGFGYFFKQIKTVYFPQRS